MRILHDERVRALLVIAVIYGLVIASPTWVLKTLTVTDGHNVVHAHVFRGTVAEALRQLDMPLHDGDIVSPDRSEPLRTGMQVAVERATAAVILVDGAYQVHSHPADTIGQFLEGAGIELGPMDKVSPSLDATMEPGIVIRVVRVREEEQFRTAPIAYETLLWAEPKWVRGESGQLRAGKQGTEQQRLRLTYEDDRLVHTLITETTVLEPPVAEIIGIGTRILVHSMETPGGLIRYTDVMQMEATAYYPGPESTGIWADGFTSTGLRAGHGIIAVDPKVIPLGTRVYVPGYGVAVAGDIGGAIRGDIIDLAFDTYREAIHYGRQQVSVYILAAAGQ